MEYGLIMNIKFPIRCTGLSVDESNLKHLRKEFNENTNTSKTQILICVPALCTVQCGELNSKEHKLIRITNVLKWRGKYLDPELRDIWTQNFVIYGGRPVLLEQQNQGG